MCRRLLRWPLNPAEAAAQISVLTLWKGFLLQLPAGANVSMMQVSCIFSCIVPLVKWWCTQETGCPSWWSKLEFSSLPIPEKNAKQRKLFENHQSYTGIILESLSVTRSVFLHLCLKESTHLCGESYTCSSLLNTGAMQITNLPVTHPPSNRKSYDEDLPEGWAAPLLHYLYTHAHSIQTDR